jgi:putative transposase
MHAKTSSFVAEFPLCTTAADDACPAIRLDAAPNIYNASLGESLCSLYASNAWHERQVQADTKQGAIGPVQSHPVSVRVLAASIQKFAETCRDACWIGEHIGSHDTQTTSLLTGIQGCPNVKG